MNILILFIISIFIMKLCKIIISSKLPTKITIDFKSAFENKTLEKMLLFIPQKKEDVCNKKLSTKTYINKRGYKCFKDSHYLVHRWVMEKKINRKLKPNEVVHHIDGNKLNNKEENLRLFANQNEHDKHHREIFKKYGFWYEINKEYSLYKKSWQYIK